MLILKLDGRSFSSAIEIVLILKLLSCENANVLDPRTIKAGKQTDRVWSRGTVQLIVTTTTTTEFGIWI